MDIPLITKTKALQPSSIQEAAQNSPKELKNEEAGKDIKSRRDSAEISASHGNVFEDKRLSAFKSSLLYELSSDNISKKASDIKEQVEDGSYMVESGVLADSLID
jgi:anti-sigma28 factor (negative regulator of flagellin synthesis)